MKKSKFYKAKMAVRKRRSLFIRGIFSAAMTLLCCGLFAQLDTLVFEYSGAPESWMVPSGIDEVSILAAGAQGGYGSGTDGGYGFRVQGDVAVSPGDVLHIYVGGEGETATNGNFTGGGWNGGGDAIGGFGTSQRGGGGGASDVRIGGTTLSDRVIVGGGGGGSANFPNTGGHGGGDEGDDGVGWDAAGKGGTQSQGGTGSDSGCDPGEFGIGGSASTGSMCAGGGGGYYGGGSGSGAGGGSSYIGGVINGEYLSGLRNGDGIVLIIYSQGIENDLCQNPLLIGCGEAIFGNTENATPDNPACRGISGTGGGLWYSFVGTGQNTTVSTCHPGTNYDTYLSVYAADCNEPICVAQNDNSTGCFNSGKSELTFFAGAGGFYKILVDGPNGAEGDFQLTVTCGLPCQNAEVIPCGTFSATGTTENALIDFSPSCGSIPNGRGNWYTFQGDGLCHTFSTCDSEDGITTDFDTQLSVYEGGCLDLQCVAYNDDYENCSLNVPTTSRVSFSTEVGTQYYVLVHGKYDEVGNYALWHHCSYDDILSIICPEDGTVDCGQSWPVEATNLEEWIAMGGEIYSDACSNGPYTFSSVDVPFAECELEGQLRFTRIYSITDESSGKTESCEQNFYCGPTPNISITCPAPQFLNCGWAAPSPASTLAEFEGMGGSASGGCDIVSISHIDTGYDCDNTGDVVVSRQYIVTDAAGNTGFCVQEFFCTAPPPLVAACPQDITLDCDEDVPPMATNILEFMDIGGQVSGGMCDDNGYIGAYIFVENEYSEGDPCDGTIITREYTITAIATGEIFYCEHNIELPPIGLPVLTTQPPFEIECAEELGNMDLLSFLTVTFPDGVCQGNVGLGYTDIPDYPFINCDPTSLFIEFRFINDCEIGVSATQEFILINDGVQVEFPEDEIVECSDDIQVSPADITVSTPCGMGSPQIVIQGPQIVEGDGHDCNGNVYKVTYSFSDACNGFHSHDRFFTIQNEGIQVEVAEDQEVDCADDIEVSEDDVIITSPCGEQIEAEFDGPIISNPSNPNCSGVTHTYRYYFNDDCDQFYEYFRTFTIQNKELTLIPVNPELDGISDGDIVSIQCQSNVDDWGLPQFDASSFDFSAACNLEADLEFVFEDLGAANCAVDGYAHAYSYTWTVSDECSSTVSFSFTIQIVDEIDPILHGVPADMILECTVEIPLPPTVTATDECECADIFFKEEDLSSNICSGNKIILRTWTAMDCCGNEVSQTQRITLEDHTAPELAYDGLHGTEIMYSGGTTIECSDTEEVEWLYSLDNNSIFVDETCSENYTVVYTLSGYTPPSCEVAGFKEEWEPTWKVTDDCGNSATFSFLVRVEDNTAPYLLKSDVMYICPDDTEGYAWVEDGCSNTNSTYEDELVEGCIAGVYMRTYTMEDHCGNISQDEQMIVDLSQKPNLIEFIGQTPEALSISCSNDNGKLTDFDEKSVQTIADCLPNLEVIFYEQMASSPCEDGKSLIELIWTATTPCGYVDSLVIKAEMIDNKAPVFRDFQDSIVMECSAAMPEITAIDDCSSVEIDYEIIEEQWGCANESRMTRIITATDACGNSTTVSQDVYIIDTEGPTINESTHICQSENDQQVEAYDECEGRSIEATLVKAERIECGGHDVIVNTYEAVDACGNMTTFEQSVYPDDFELTFEVSDPRLAVLNAGGPKQINESEFVKYSFLYGMDESSVLAFTPCDDVLMGEFDGTVRINEDCEDGVSRVLTFTWTFMAGCSEDYTYEIEIEVMADDIEEIILEPVDDVYCDDEIPELVILNQHEEFEYNVEVTDNRNAYGDGYVTRTVTMIDNCGNESKAEQLITYYATSDLTCNIEGNFSPGCNTPNNIYEVAIGGGTAPYTIEWTANGGDCSIEFVDGETANINIGFGKATIYATVTDANGCVSTCEAEVSCVGMMIGNIATNEVIESDQVAEVKTEVSEKEDEEKFAEVLDVVTITDFKVFPNPFIETVHLELPKLEETQKVLVLDGSGRVVYTKSVGSGTVAFSIDLSTLNAGIYFIQHINSHGKTSKKVIKL